MILMTVPRVSPTSLSVTASQMRSAFKNNHIPIKIVNTEGDASTDRHLDYIERRHEAAWLVINLLPVNQLTVFPKNIPTLPQAFQSVRPSFNAGYSGVTVDPTEVRVDRIDIGVSRNDIPLIVEIISGLLADHI